MSFPDFTYSYLSSSDNATVRGVFEPFRSRVEIAVVYEKPTSSEVLPGKPYQVIDHMNDNYFQVLQAAPFKIPNEANDGMVGYLSFHAVHEWHEGAPCSDTESLVVPAPIESIEVRRESENVWVVTLGLVIFARKTINSVLTVNGRKRGIQVWQEPEVQSDGSLDVPGLTWVNSDLMWQDLINCEPAGGEAGIALVDGREVDLNGEPLTKSISQSALTISFVLRAPYVKDEVDDGLTADASWTTWAIDNMNLQESRNIQVIFGSAPSTVLLESISITPLNILEYQRCDVTFVKDDWNHLTQQPITFFGATTGLTPRCPQDENSDPDNPTILESVFGTTNVIWLNSILYGFETNNDILNHLPCNAGAQLDKWDWGYE